MSKPPSRYPTPSPSKESIAIVSSQKEEVLGNPDLLSSIFSNFLPFDKPSREDITEARKELVNIALTCSSFRDPALDCLWRSIESLIPLIRLIPLVEEIDGTYCVHDIVELGSTLQRYARRVRSIRISDVSIPSLATAVNPMVYVLLSQQLNGEPLFPGLESITLHSLPIHFSWQALPLLLPSRSLERIEICDSALDDSWFYRFGLPLLASRASAHAIRLTLRHPTATVQPTLWKTITKFYKLETLSLCLPGSTNMPDDFIFQLGRSMDRLSDLTLDIHFPAHIMPANGLISPNLSTLSTASPPLRQGLLYRNLKSLSLINRAETSICQCFSVAPLIQHLTSFTFDVTPTSLPSLPALVEHLANYPSLKRVELKQVSANINISVDQILPFLQRLDLEDFVLDSIWSMCGSANESADSCFDRVLEETSKPQQESNDGNAPRRRFLRSLLFPRGWAVERTSLTSLAAVPTKSPALRELKFAIDSCSPRLLDPSLPRLSASNSDGDYTNSLEYLEIDDARTGNVAFTPNEYQIIARYLDGCFPNLNSVKLGPFSNQFCVPHWEHIEHLRSIYKQNRRLLSP